MNLLRGNHESRSMTTDFTFREEVLEKFDEEVYEMFMDVFDNLPIAAHVSGKYLCVHGGISPDLKKLPEI
jgi:serine/threonine-protein phosphatase 2B catalytic subunit